MKYTTGIFLCLLIAAFGCRRTSPLTREEVIAAIKQFDDGWKNKNSKTVDSVLAPSYVYFTQSGGTFNRDSIIQTAASPVYVLDNVSRSAFVVELYENTAVVSTRWQGKGIYKGVPFDEDQRCSITIVKNGRKVEILSEHCTPIKINKNFH